MFDSTSTRPQASRRAATSLASCVIAAILFAGCTTVVDETRDGLAPDESGSIADTDVSDDDGAPPAMTPFPRITSCDQVTGVIPSFVHGMTLVGESVADDGVLCQWSAPDDGPFVSVTVTAADDVPTQDVLAMEGKMLRLSPTSIDDPRLDGVNGLGVRWTTDGASGSPGYAKVYVPGVTIELHDGRRGDSGTESYPPDDDTTVTVALAVLGV